MATAIGRDELRSKLEGPGRPVIAEALPERYFRHGHLPGAVQLPHEGITAEVARRLGDVAGEVVVYCASETCMNSHQAAAQLERLGFTRVRVYAGGKQDWQQAGLPLVRD